MERLQLEKYIKNDRLSIHAKPGSAKTEILGYDDERKTLKVAIAAPADKNKANIELLKFLKRQTGRQCELSAGNSSKDKIVRFL